MMKRRSGRIVSIASIVGVTGNAGQRVGVNPVLPRAHQGFAGEFQKNPFVGGGHEIILFL
jgi:hypothetical protein